MLDTPPTKTGIFFDLEIFAYSTPISKVSERTEIPTKSGLYEFNRFLKSSCGSVSLVLPFVPYLNLFLAGEVFF